ncbi:MAG: SUMF1/EgtB/PvdO family nonheme iron enzyme [Muribaculaceae bacterium]|nr:SUMF1/EgtB/PvdO family nonheme iron enzyme [Muribaculaceae bacterium]
MGKRLRWLLFCLFLVALAAPAQDGVTPQNGDVNNDNEVNIADVNAVIDIILDGGTYSDAADVNHDGEINIADLNAVIGLVLDEHVEKFTVGGVTFSMVEVEGGTFSMQYWPQVTLSPFAIGQTEVTQALWEAVMGSNPSYFNGDPYLPVEQVSWDDCQEFISKLNEMTGRTFRLPSEAEWEFAARGGNYSHGYSYAGSDDIDQVAWYRQNADYKTHPVAGKAPNELGLYDMSGNVMEVCLDGYSSLHISNPLINPIAPCTNNEHVGRGGAYSIDKYSCHPTSRGPIGSSTRASGLGLRLAMGEPVYDMPMSLSKYEIDINDGWCDTVAVTGGSGLYQVECDNSDILPTSLDSTTIRVDAFNVGQALITVSDLTTGEQATVNVTVNPSEFEIMKFTVGDETFAMIKVDGGTFMMGATPEQETEATDDERPVHEVTLSSFFIGQTEVSVGLWKTVMGYNPIPYYIPEYVPPVNAAAYCLSWDKCQEFIAKLNEMTGRTFRMPTEAEWEFAARGGNHSHGYKYAGSDNLDEVALYSLSYGQRYPLVRTKIPNELGLYNMSGNVWEWCQDWFGAYGSESLVNPVGPESGTGRVIRGGSYFFLDPNYCRVSFRTDKDPATDNFYIGLRLVMDDNTSAP